MQELDRDDLRGLGVVALADLGHAAPTQDTPQFVAAAEQFGDEHGGSP